MVMHRIHQLATDWGVTSKEIIDRLERMGIKGKRAQSGLSDADAERVRGEMGLGGGSAEPVVVRRTVEVRDAVGEAVTAVDTITETHVKRGVLVRRTQRTALERSGERAVPILKTPALRVATSVALAPDVLATLDRNEYAYASTPAVFLARSEPAIALPETTIVAEPVPAPIVLPTALVEEGETDRIDDVTEEAPAAAIADEPSVADADPAAEEPLTDEIPVLAESEEDDLTPVDEPDKLAEELLSHAKRAEQDKAQKEAPTFGRQGSVRVLGKIDLSRKAAAPAPVEKPAAPAAPAADDKPGRKKKRKVVRKEDLFDDFERAMSSRQRRPMKKRVAPGQRVAKTELTTPKASKRVVRINEVTSPGELAKAMSIKAGEVLSALMRLGVMKAINDALDLETASVVADEFGYTVENTAVNVEDLLQTGTNDEAESSATQPRAPVVTVMGHVDHGKTSLLDAIRRTNVASGEAGGITQHIGAYNVQTPNGDICFLDTPGHEAFTAMRARGAKVTDIVVLVVAADDGVMPQTIEAVNHAKAAEVPVVVAVNKIDKPGANPDRIKQQLTELGLQPEDWGGDTQYVHVSALKREGIDELMEAIGLAAEVLELSAAIDRPARGIVIEARLDKGRGPVATVIVQEGTLKRGDFYVVGETAGRVRAMLDDMGRDVKEAGPSHAVEIIGLESVPQAGDALDVVPDQETASHAATLRRSAARPAAQAVSARFSLEDLQRQVAAGETNELKVIIKADVQGSAEALKQALEKLSTQEVGLNVIHSGVGAISESDVQLALAARAVVVGFHVRPEAKARALAEREGVDLRLHTIIYEVISELKAAMEGLLAPEFKETLEGRAEVRNVFSLPGGVVIAGSYVAEGKITRNGQCRLLRDNVVVYTGRVGSLRRFKDDAREVQSGYECGIGLERFNDVKVGDVIECFRMDAIKRTLESAGKATQPQASA
jgi:translation initiation factor IF-2